MNMVIRTTEWGSSRLSVLIYHRFFRYTFVSLIFFLVLYAIQNDIKKRLSSRGEGSVKYICGMGIMNWNILNLFLGKVLKLLKGNTDLSDLLQILKFKNWLRMKRIVWTKRQTTQIINRNLMCNIHKCGAFVMLNIFAGYSTSNLLLNK